MPTSEVKAHLGPLEDRAARVREELAQYEHSLHVLEQPVLAPADAARLYAELTELEAAGAAQALDSPTLRRRFRPRSRFEVEMHREPWPELARISSVGELRSHHARINEAEGGDPVYVASATVPGAEVVLTYVRGVLERVLLRGDGVRGEDVTENARTLGSVPLLLRRPGSTVQSRVSKLTREALGPATTSPVPPFPDELHVRGLITMRIADITALDRRRVDSGEPPYISPRGAVLGSLRRLDARVTANRRLTLFALGVDRMPPDCDTHWQLLGALKSWGFAVMPVTWRCSGLSEVLDFIAALHQLAPSFEYPLEGGLLRVSRAGYAARARGNGTAEAVMLSFPPPGRPAVVSSVYYAVGRGGAVLPVATLEKAAGQELTVPERAPVPADSGQELLGLRRGSAIRVRPGSVAPVVTLERAEAPAPLVPACPMCAQSLVQAVDDAFQRCDNPTCRGRARARLLHLIGPRGLKLESLGVKAIDRLIADPGVLDAADLLSLEAQVVEAVSPGKGALFREEVAKLPRLPLWRLLYLLAIPHVSEHAARVVAQQVFELERLERLTDEDCEALPIPPDAARGLAQWLATEGPRLLRRLKQLGVRLAEGPENFPAPFMGKALAIAGELESTSAVQLADELERRGALVLPRVVRGADFLLAGKNPGKALEAAKSYGVFVLEEAAVLAVLRTS